MPRGYIPKLLLNKLSPAQLLKGLSMLVNTSGKDSRVPWRLMVTRANSGHFGGSWSLSPKEKGEVERDAGVEGGTGAIQWFLLFCSVQYRAGCLRLPVKPKILVWSPDRTSSRELPVLVSPRAGDGGEPEMSPQSPYFFLHCGESFQPETSVHGTVSLANNE